MAQLGAMRRLLDGVARAMPWTDPVAIVRTDSSMPAFGDRLETVLDAASRMSS